MMGGGAIALGVASCSFLLDWKGYTGGAADGDASEDDASGPADDAAADVAVRDARSEAALSDAAPCGPATCGGCCNASGFCSGGESKSTCGTGGESCQNCALTGATCQAGACSSAPPPGDSGTPAACDAQTCGQMLRCAPVYQTACCLSDGTCGCQVNFPPSACM